MNYVMKEKRTGSCIACTIFQSHDLLVYRHASSGCGDSLRSAVVWGICLYRHIQHKAYVILSAD